MKVKKRYVAGPLTLVVVALIWNVALHRPPQLASAEELKPYINPTPIDARFPIDVYSVALNAGETKTDVLARLPVKIFPEDRVTFVVDPALGLGSVVQVERAAPVVVKDGKVTLQKRTFSNTIGELLTEINRPLEGLDKANFGSESPIARDMKIVVTRVAKVQRTVTLPEPFTTVTKDDANMNKGTQRVSQAGKKGVRTKIIEDTRHDGEVVSSVVLSNTVTTKPVEEIIFKGTKPVITRPCKGYDDQILDAAIKNKVDPNELCARLVAESNGRANASGAGGKYLGLFQYESGFWASASAKAGYAGASVYDTKAQIYVTAWAWANGYRGRWPL